MIPKELAQTQSRKPKNRHSSILSKINFKYHKTHLPAEAICTENTTNFFKVMNTQDNHFLGGCEQNIANELFVAFLTQFSH